MIKQAIKAAVKKTPMYWAYSTARKNIHQRNKEREAIQKAMNAPHVVIKQDTSLDDRLKLYQLSFFAEFSQYFGARTVKVQDAKYGMGELIYNIDFCFFPLGNSYVEGFDAYFKQVKCAERALIRKAQKNGFLCKSICYGEHLDEVFAINTSKDERQGKNMSEQYVKYPLDHEAIVKSVGQTVRSFGCFDKNGVLMAYTIYERFGDVFHTVKFLGHKDVLSFGVMNYLFAFAVQSLSRDYPACTILYGGGGQMGSHNSRNTRA